jgi:hypothetical protein
MFGGSAVQRLLKPEPRSHTGKGVDLWGACGTAAEDNEHSDESHALTIVHDRGANRNRERDLLKI